MSTTYEVQYIVSVEATAAIQTINNFKRTAQSLTAAQKPFMEFERVMRNTLAHMASLGKERRVNLNTQTAFNRLRGLIRLTRELKRELSTIPPVNLQGGTTAARPTSSATTPSSNRSGATPPPAPTTPPPPPSPYKLKRGEAPSGYYGTGKAMTFYGPDHPDMPALPGNRWVQNSNMHVNGVLQKDWERALHTEKTAQNILNGQTQLAQRLAASRQEFNAASNQVSDARNSLARYESRAAATGQLADQYHNRYLSKQSELSALQAQKQALQQANAGRRGHQQQQAYTQQLNALNQQIAAVANQAENLKYYRDNLNSRQANSALMARRSSEQLAGAESRLRSATLVNDRFERANANATAFAEQNQNATKPFTTGWNQQKVSGGGGPMPRTRSSSRVARTPKTPSAPFYARGFRTNAQEGLAYQALGPTPLSGNAGLVAGMLKGMGIAYGISAIGQFISEVITSSTEYDNIMQTVKNILQTHDTKGGFRSRFSEMETIVRDLGRATKFTVVEVAQASKFLAMAGLTVEQIKTTMAPVVDVALIGDTDLGETADVMTNIMTAYKKKAEDMQNVADIMTNTFTMTNVTLTELAESYKYSASLLYRGGVEMEVSAAAIGILGDAGMKGSQAGTTLRTILGNMVNPTKKQRAHWQAIGIDPTSGDIFHVFKQLQGKKLALQDFYKLFHRTAAQGAAALVGDVDKWNKVITENYESGGIARHLAQQKQNTIQGLWASLTSTITDQGLKGFESIQPIIASKIKGFTAALADPETTAKFKTGAKEVMHFFDMVIDSTKRMLTGVSWFLPVIMEFAKLQILIMPFVQGIKALKMVFNGFSAVRGACLNLSLFSRSIKSLSADVRMSAGLIASSKKQVMWQNAYGKTAGGIAYNSTAGIPGIRQDRNVLGNWKSNLAMFDPSTGKTMFLPVDAKTAANPRYKKYRAAVNWRVLKNQGAQVGGMGLGMLGAYMATRELTSEDSNLAEKWSGGAWGAASALAMCGALGPAAAMAVGAVALKFGALVYKTYEAVNSMKEYTSQFQVLGGVLVHENMTAVEKYWQNYLDLQIASTKTVQDRVRALKEEEAIKNGGKANPGGAEGYSVDTYKKLFPGLDAVTGFLGHFGAAQDYAQEAASFMVDGKKFSRFTNVGTLGYVSYNGHKATFDDPESYARAAMLYKTALTGEQQQSIKEEMTRRLKDIVLSSGYMNGGAAFRDLQNDYSKNMIGTLLFPTQESLITKADMENLEWKNKSVYNKLGLWDATQQFHPESTLWSDIYNYVKQEQKGKVDVVTALKYASAGGLGDVLNKPDILNAFANKQWDYLYDAFGMKGGKFQDKYHADAAIQIAGTFKQIVEAMGACGQKELADAKTFFSIIASYASGMKFGLSNNIAGNLKSYADGAVEKSAEGVEYQYSALTHMWNLLNPAAAKSFKVPSMIDDFTFQSSIQAKNARKLEDENNSYGGVHSQYSQDYESKYKSNQAAPKQVILNIDKLLSVEKVDMSNPEKKKAVDELTAEIVPALTSVLGEVTYVWHGDQSDAGVSGLSSNTSIG